MAALRPVLDRLGSDALNALLLGCQGPSWHYGCCDICIGMHIAQLLMGVEMGLWTVISTLRIRQHHMRNECAVATDNYSIQLADMSYS